MTNPPNNTFFESTQEAFANNKNKLDGFAWIFGLLVMYVGHAAFTKNPSHYAQNLSAFFVQELKLDSILEVRDTDQAGVEEVLRCIAKALPAQQSFQQDLQSIKGVLAKMPSDGPLC